MLQQNAVAATVALNTEKLTNSSTSKAPTR